MIKGVFNCWKYFFVVDLVYLDIRQIFSDLVYLEYLDIPLKLEIVGNKAKRLSKWVFQENKARQIS